MLADNLTDMVRRLCLLLALAIVVAACTNGSATTSTESSVGTVTTPSESSDTTSEIPEETTTTIVPTWTELPGLDALPQEIQDELLELVRLTEEVRDLEFSEPPTITVVTRAELEQRVRTLIQEDAEDFPSDEALYKLLGLLDPDADLETMLTDLYGEQVAGFYDGETGELVVAIREDGFSVVQRGTLVHELTHAVTDQHFEFDPVINQMFDDDRLDQVSAFQGLVEGDASMAEILYLQTLSQR